MGNREDWLLYRGDGGGFEMIGGPVKKEITGKIRCLFLKYNQ